MDRLIAGTDEAGRGPLVGSVVAAAVILNPDQPIDGLTDSKKLTEKKREALFEEIQRKALCFAWAEATPEEIDEHNIFHASLLAMKRAVEMLSITPHELIVDGKFCPKVLIPSRAIIKGDLTEPAISAASIVAKVIRDQQMRELDALHPQYGFAQHKGYPTAAHLEALAKFGVLPQHRKSFRPVQLYLESIS